MLPDFLICGAQKSGTTSLSNGLSNVPGVFLPDKEIHFFTRNWDKGLDWYKNIFSEKKDLLGEKSVSYMSFEEAAQRIKEIIPNAKLIFILREPVQRAYSHYWMAKRLGWETKDFKKAVYRKDKDYIQRGLYVQHLERFLEYFSKDQMLVLVFKDLKNNPEKVFSRIFYFLGIDHKYEYVPLNKKSNVGGVPRIILISRFEAFLKFYFKLEKIPNLIKKINNTHSGYPVIPEDVKKELKELYAPWNKKLLELFPDLNIKHWF